MVPLYGQDRALAADVVIDAARLNFAGENSRNQVINFTICYNFDAITIALIQNG